MLALKTPAVLLFIPFFLGGCGLLESDSGKSMWAEEDLDDFAIYANSPDGDSISGSIEVGSMIDQIYLTPKDRYAVVNDWMSSYFVIDLKEREVIKKQQYIENNVATLSVQGMYLVPQTTSIKL